jgi:hypothetical protein
MRGARSGRRQPSLALLAVAIVTALGMSACSPSTGWPTVKPTSEPAPSASLDYPGLLPDETPAVVAGPDLGEAWTTEPDPAAFVTLPDGLRVAPDQYLIMLDPSASQADAEEVASWIGGTIAGHIAYIGVWKVVVQDNPDPTGVQARLDILAAQKGVLAAAPVALATVDAGPDCAPALQDPVYTGSSSKSYDIIHVKDAWQALYASGLPLNPVHIGFLDTVLTHDPTGRIPWEFGDVSFVGDSNTTPNPEKFTQANQDPSGFHHADGTLGILAGSGQNGGIAGIASPLGSRLLISHDVLAGPNKNLDPKDTQRTSKWSSEDGTSYTDANLISTLREIESGSTIISGSWGTGVGSGNAAGAAMWKKFVTQMARDHPNVLFVYSAGNDNKPLDGVNAFPGGIASPNLITVGNIDNDLSRDRTSNSVEPGSNGEVTLGAPGNSAVWGKGLDGQIRDSNGGTSSAAPMVSATAALIRSIDPSLSAAQIKTMIAETADVGDAEVGGQTLRVDLAVRAAIDGQRAKQRPPLGPLTDEDIAASLQYCQIDLIGELKERLTTPAGSARWEVRASLPAIPGPVGVSLVVNGLRLPNGRQTVTAPAQPMSWTFLVDKSGAKVTATRLDNGYWIKYTLFDKGVTPSPTASPTPAAQPTYDCNNPPSDPIDYNRWYLHCKPIGG